MSAADTVPVYAPELNEIIKVPASDAKMYRDGGYATGGQAQAAMSEEATKTPIVALANAANTLGLGFPKRLLDKYSPESARKLAEYEEERPWTKTLSSVAGGVLPFATGAGLGEAALGVAGKYLGAGAAGATLAGNEASSDAEVAGSGLTTEQLATAMGLGGLLGVLGEAAPAAMKAIGSKMSHSTASYLERLSNKPYFEKTVIDPLKDARDFDLASSIVPRDSYAGPTGFDSVGEAPTAAPTPPGAPGTAPPLPSREVPTIGRDEFNFAPTEQQLIDRQISEMMSRKGLREATQRQADLVENNAIRGKQDAFDAWENDIERAGNPYERDLFRSMRDEQAGNYTGHEPPTEATRLDDWLASKASAGEKLSATEREAWRKASAGDVPMAAPGDVHEVPRLPDFSVRPETLPDSEVPFPKGKPPRMPTARQMGKQLLRDAPLPDLPSEAQLAESAGRDAMPVGRLANDPPLKTIYEFKPGESPLAAGWHAAAHKVGPLSLAFGLGGHGLSYQAAKGAAIAAQRMAEFNLLKHQTAVQGIVDFMTGAPMRAVGVTAKAILQGKTGDIASNYLSPDVDEAYHTVANGVNAAAANPERINDYYQHRYGALGAGNPAMLAGIVQHQTQKVMHLSQLLPQSPQPLSILSEPYDPPRSAKLEFLARYKAADDPFHAMVSPTAAVVDTVQATNPQIHNQLVTILQGVLSDPKEVKRLKLTREQTRVLSLILGADVRPYDNAAYVAQLQQNAQAATAQSPEGQPAQPANKPINLGKQAGSFVSSVGPPSQQNDLDDAGAT